jgi:anaerobic ribonucleoside-triphosphate reductase activating protein
MLTIAKFDRYDMVNNPNDETANITIWFSGCTFRCSGCYNTRLWHKEFGLNYPAESVAKIVIGECDKLGLKSVVLLGGEPLQQDRQELLLLCRLLKEADLKIWIYTGYDFQDADEFGILEFIYTVKCGKYMEQLKQDGFPASSNQRVYRRVDNKFKDITDQFRR